MVTWLNLSPAVRIARNERQLRWTVAGIAIGVCFVLAFIF